MLPLWCVMLTKIDKHNLQSAMDGFKITNLINFLCKCDISDCTNGLRAFSPKILTKIKLKERTYSAPEILIETVLKGFRIKNIPTTIKRRTKGETKKPRLGFALGLFRVIIITWLHNKV